MNVAETIPIKAAGQFWMPAYGLGTWGMGGTFTSSCTDDAKCIQAIRRAVDAGITHIDTAEMYGAGHAEELVGQAIRGYPRKDLFIASKALAHHLAYDDLIAAAERSISRMACEYLDLYMVHHPSDDIPIADTMRGMSELVRRGFIRNVGVCNFSRERLHHARSVSPVEIVCNQVHYSLEVREPESSGLLTYCQENNVMLVAWQPIDRGAYSHHPSALLRDLCDKYQCTPVQLALSWVIAQPNVAAISRTLSPEHLAENIASTRIMLDRADVEMLRSAYDSKRTNSDVYALR